MRLDRLQKHKAAKQQRISPPSLAAVKDAAWAAQEVGSCQVASLDWSDPACYASFQPPYDFILAADCVYSELAGEAAWHLYRGAVRAPGSTASR